MNVAIDTDFLVRLSVGGHQHHREAVSIRDQHLDQQDRFAVSPQVLNEFIHVVTDSRRFAEPLDMDQALGAARFWWEAEEVIPMLPNEGSVQTFFDLMKQHRLGRKRILDTSLAAQCIEAKITHLITSNVRDYRIFPEITIIELS